LHVLGGIEILAGRDRRVIGGGDLGIERVVERMARLLEPFEAEGLERRRVDKGGGAIELAIGVDREAAFAA